MNALTEQPITHGIKAWPASERPRERLMRGEASKLSEAELLALLLRSGVPGKDAVALGRELLNNFDGLRGLLQARTEQLKKIAGLGAAKIAGLLAVSELAQRYLREEMPGRDVIRDPQTVVDYLYAALRDRKREVFKVIFLDKANRVIGDSDLFIGTIDEAAVHPREVVKAALDRFATAVILVHNHPSGRVEPSPEDRRLTDKIKAACETVSIKVLDHIIVGDNQHFSFREAGLL